MTILNGKQILDCIDKYGMIEGWKIASFNAASMDIHLGHKILKEIHPQELREGKRKIISLARRDKLCMQEIDISKGSYILRPGEFILAQSQEVFNLPAHISAEYKLKSSMARIGLEHLNAGWCDAGWNGSVLTLELRNMTTYHDIEICPGNAIGQMIFYEHDEVPPELSYATKGNYNGHKEVNQAGFQQANLVSPGEE